MQLFNVCLITLKQIPNSTNKNPQDVLKEHIIKKTKHKADCNIFQCIFSQVLDFFLLLVVSIGGS